MNTRSIAAAALVAVSMLAGCAITTDRIALQYTAQRGVAPVAGASEVPVAVQVTDSRQDKSKVSNKKNGFGIEMAPIVAVEDVAVTIRRAIEQELRARGFPLATQNESIQVSAEITRFYSEHKMGFFAGDAVADLNLSVVVTGKPAGLRYSRQVVAQGIEPNTQLATGENAGRALNRALENGLKILFEDPSFTAALLAAKAAPGKNPM